jgi:Glycosyltransferase family 87
MESSRPSATASGGGRQAALISLVSRNRVETAVLGCWVLTLVVICLHAGINPGRHSVFTNYRDAGARWIRGEYLYLYPYSNQFLYSPLAAALFAPFALLPQALGGILWRLISAIALILGARMSARMAWPGAGGIRWAAWGLAALLPLSLSDLNNGQAGVLVTAFLLFGIVFCANGRWQITSACFAIATIFKLYPIALALLLAALYPGKLSWRLALWLAALFLLTFLLQHRSYVLTQYQEWFGQLAHDDRRLKGAYGTWRDAWLLLRLARVPMTLLGWTALQLVAGVLAAAFCVWGQRSGWNGRRCLAAAFWLASAWMTLFGPATEASTYIILAPAVIFGLITSWSSPHPAWLRTGMSCTYGLLVAADILNSWFHPATHVVYVHAVQPFTALIFVGLFLVWLSSDRLW